MGFVEKLAQWPNDMPLETIERAVNEVSDRDASWWPFLWLRPEKNAPLSLSRVAALSILYGVPCSALMAILLRGAVARPLDSSELVVTAFAFPLLCLLCGSALVAPMWNRRAERVRLGRRD